MKLNIRTLSSSCIFIITLGMQSQNMSPQGGEVIFNASQEACLTGEDHEFYISQMIANKALLDGQGRRAFQHTNTSQQVFFEWPVRQANGFDYASTWSISNYVDHNPNTNQLQD